MKPLITIVSLFLGLIAFGQTNTIDTIYKLTLPYRPAKFIIMKDTSFIASTTVNNDGKVTFSEIKSGTYKIKISGQGKAISSLDDITIIKGQKLIISFKINGPCLFDHPINYIPTCPYNHQDSIIRIAYGLISKRGDTFIKDKKEIKVKYGGCIISDCNPQFYCKQHDIDF